VAITEIAGELDSEGVGDVRNPNLGGTVSFDWGSVKLVPAWHSSTTPKGTVSPPAGLIIEIGGKTIYHLGDTALFGDLELIGRRHAIDVAFVCIGGHFTMDRHDAVEAVRLIGPHQVIPCHYDTFPAIQTDVGAFKADAEGSTASEVLVLAPGECHST
jgi:L-ascorbate metabolism protein UlaG (beta-lactamase superfamily)